MTTDQRDSRNMLLSLLLDMRGEYGEPELVDLSELTPEDKLFLLTTCCTEMIIAAIQVQAKGGADAVKGVEALFETIKQRVQESGNGNQRPN